MPKVVISEGVGVKYPPIPEIKWQQGAHNLADIESFLGAHYPKALEEASQEIGRAMPKSARGLVGRVEGNIKRKGFIDKLALQGTTEKQIVEAVSDTKDFLTGKMRSLHPVARPDLDSLGEHWNEVLDEATSTLVPTERLVNMAKAVLETWRDIRVFTAMPKAQKILEQQLFEQQKGLPEPKGPGRK
jgi:hypothetical protein